MKAPLCRRWLKAVLLLIGPRGVLGGGGWRLRIELTILKRLSLKERN